MLEPMNGDSAGHAPSTSVVTGQVKGHDFSSMGDRSPSDPVMTACQGLARDISGVSECADGSMAGGSLVVVLGRPYTLKGSKLANPH